MTVAQLLAALSAANVSPETEVYGPTGPLRTLHFENGVLVLEESPAEIIRHIGRIDDTLILWPEPDPVASPADAEADEDQLSQKVA